MLWRRMGKTYERWKRIYYYENGNRYNDYFNNNKREGKGIIFLTTEKYRIGNLLNDELKEKLFLISLNWEAIDY